jgi:hypothetical protein
MYVYIKKRRDECWMREEWATVIKEVKVLAGP